MQNEKNINIVKKHNLCLSCEICLSLCPQNCISMAFEGGQNIPCIDMGACTNCGICLKYCPGMDIDRSYLDEGRDIEEMMTGKYRDCYTAYAKDTRIRKNSTSGGLITSMVTELIGRGDYEAVFACSLGSFSPEDMRLEKMSGKREIFESAGSKYIPASVFNIMEALKDYNGQKYIIVATPCMVSALKKYIRSKKIDGRNLLFLGLFCEKVLNLNIIKYFEHANKRGNEKIQQFHYKYKYKTGWPGDVKLIFDSAREKVLPSSEREKLKRFFQLERCMYCLDKLNKSADISFGDCYIRGEKEHLGKSSVIVRTVKGRGIFNSLSHLFEYKNEDIAEITKSQKLGTRSKNARFVKLFFYKNIPGGKKLDIKINNPAAIDKAAGKARQYIRLGADKRFKRIRLLLFLTAFEARVFSFLRKMRAVAANIIKILIILFEGIFRYGKLFYSADRRKISDGEGNISILGGNLINKGAQAMTFTVVDQLRAKGFREKIYLLSSKDFYDRYNKKEIYDFDFLPWDINLKLLIISPWARFLPGRKESKQVGKLMKSIGNCRCFIDISGYALSTQWGLVRSLNYMLNIMIARRYGIDFYILPQSIGPFNYPGKFILGPLLKLYLKYPEKIYIREKDGMQSIKPYTGENITKTHDMVLLNPSYRLSNIFTGRLKFKKYKLTDNPVCIIPNLKLAGILNYGDIVLMYGKIIKELLKKKRNVYIFSHSTRDLELSLDIKRNFLDNTKVNMISSNLNALELEDIIKQADFLIASRYHSIVHAYKNGVPAIIIGWALKYRELAQNFGQQDYFFDNREEIDFEDLKKAIGDMLKNHKKESVHIKKAIKEIRKDNVFDSIFDDIYKT